jgi:hypothetical protein
LKMVNGSGVVNFSPHQHSLNSSEANLVASLVKASVDADVRVLPSAIINLYVALKSKPLAILVGPAHSGKVEAVQVLAHVLTGGDTARFHTLMGHAWWAGQSGNVGLFTEAQARLNAGAIIDLMAEAWQPENAGRVLIGCLARISPAEVAGLFSEVAFQLRHGQIMQLPGIHLTHPVAYPPNLLLIGTLDGDNFESPGSDLLEMATVIHWRGSCKATLRLDWPACAAGESTYLHTRIHTEREACLKLSRVLEQDPQSLQPLFRVESVLKQHHSALPSWVRGAVLVYLANAWDDSGNGLFDRHAAHQRAVAIDLALAQIVLPHIARAMAGPELSRDLISVLVKSSPVATAVLDRMSHRLVRAE